VLANVRRILALYLTAPIVRPIAKIGISPNTLTILGFLLSIAVAYLVARGMLLGGGLLLLFSGWFDLLDGALARLTGRVTRFGALLDSSLDRFSEAIVLCGLLFFYHGSFQESVLIFATLIGSVMVSYIRARAEGLGLECKVGLFTRPERLILVALGLILGWFFSEALVIILWVLAVGTNLTALERLFYLWRKTKGAE
jgi:CDP-diacylglycerol--glycerol-3-phosphate 3-phosphatidyltransferase